LDRIGWSKLADLVNKDDLRRLGNLGTTVDLSFNWRTDVTLKSLPSNNMSDHWINAEFETDLDRGAK